jgi:hypothetical protein
MRKVQRVRDVCAAAGYRGIPTEDILNALDGENDE